MSELHLEKAYELGLLTNGKYGGTFSWRVLNNKIDRLQARIETRTFSVTSQLRHDKSFGVLTPSSKVEQYCMSQMEDEQELEVLKEVRDGCISAYHSASLSTLEKKLLKEIIVNHTTIAEFARRNGIYQSYAYKIRDRGSKKLQLETKKVLSEL